MEPGSSVRVEFEDSATRGGVEDAAAVPDPPSPDRRKLFAGVVVAGLALVFGLLAFQPTEGETAAGTERQTPTSTSSPLSTTTAPATRNTVAPPLVDALAAANNPFLDADIVRGDDGFLALLSSGSVDSLPALYRSENGTDWERVFADLPPVAADGDITFLDYSELISAGQGFALLRTRTDHQRLSPIFPASRTVTERLVSFDGEEWVLDDALAAIVHDEPQRPWFHLPNSVGLLREVNVVEASQRCEVLRDQIIQSITARAALIQRFGRATPSTVDVSAAISHAQLPGAVIASFAPKASFLQSANSCGGATGVSAETSPPAIELIAPDDTVRSIQLPPEVIAANDLGAWPHPSLFGTEDGLLVLLQGSIWHLDLDTEEWTSLLEVPALFGRIMDYQIVNERFFVVLGDAVVMRGDLEVGDVAVSPIPSRLSPGSEILFADSEFVVTRSLNPDESTTQLRLPGPLFSDPQS